MSAREELRPQLIATIAEHAASWESDSQDFVDAADAVLALPSVAALLADAERVKRVREIAGAWHTTASNEPGRDAYVAMRAVYRALDGVR